MKNNFFFKKNKFITLEKVFYILKINSKPHNKKIYGVSNLSEANVNEITFFDKLSYEKYAKNTRAGFCIVNNKYQKYY